MGDSCLSAEEIANVAATADPVSLGVPGWALEPVQKASGDPKRLEGLIAVSYTHLTLPTN